MNIAIILGRGLEGCGVTTHAHELAKYFKCDLYHTTDKTWTRSSMRDDVTSKPLQIETDTNILEILNVYDLILIISVPSTSHTESYGMKFLQLVKDLKPPKVILQCDHSKPSFRRNYLFKEILEAVDLVMVHSMESDFIEWLNDNNVKCKLGKMSVGFDYDTHRKLYFKPIDQQQSNVIRWIGRTAKWKGPILMIDFHNQHLRDFMITILEGMESNIDYASYVFDKNKTLRDIENYFTAFYNANGQRIGSKIPPKNIVYGSEKMKTGPYLYPPYNHNDCMRRLAKSGFGSDLFHFNKNIYGSNIEYCHAEVVASGALPIFHKHFGDHLIHRVYDKPATQCDNSGTIWLDETNMSEVKDQVLHLMRHNNDRDDMRRLAYDFWKSHSDISIVGLELLKNIEKGL